MSRRVMVVWDAATLRRKINYDVIVESWGQKKRGRVRRRWHATFSQADRDKLSRLYPKLRRWCLVTGPPDRVTMNMSTVQLLQRAANFFGSV